MHFKIVTFEELGLGDLYNLLQLRSQVFVVEQNCVYQDIDGKDSKALHVLGYNEEELVAYTRIFSPGDYFDEAAIGRVVVKKEHRKRNYGHQILKVSIQAVQDHFRTSKIKLSAQTYLLEFYRGHGFYQIGEEYLEDGIPHTAMIKS